MTSSTEAQSNVPAANDDDKASWPIAGARVSPDDLRTIDLARVQGGYANRSEFVAAAVMEKAREILKIQRATDMAHV